MGIDKDNGSTVILESNCQSYGHYFKAEKVLYDNKSKFQRIQVIDTENLGRCLFLDCILNVSMLVEAHYHEAMAHIPIAMVDGELDVLIIGGGDLGIAKQVLKHENVKSILLSELDEEVVQVCRKYFPEFFESEKDPRLTIRISDGFEFLKNTDKKFNVVIVDSTDPAEHAPILLSDEFYSLVNRRLKNDGVLMQIVADIQFYNSAWKISLPNLKKNFKNIKPVFAPIPLYATGNWGMVMASNGNDLDANKVSQQYLDRIKGIKTMTSERVRGWLSLTPDEKEFLKSIRTLDNR